MDPGTALVTGASRGIGRETAIHLARAGMRVLACGRDRAALQSLADAAGPLLIAIPLDITDRAAVDGFIADLGGQSAVDLLVNAAGIFPDQGRGFQAVDENCIRASLDVHLFGTWRLVHALLPGMLQRGRGRIVNLTSGYGCSGMGAGMTGYRIAKAAVNALTQIAAAECKGDVKVNAVDPGWVRTDMGGPDAPRSVADAAADVVDAATLPADGPNGVLLRQRQVVAW
ncbi:MAG: SDR family oxidoreductase [Salinisphaera sp.]|nr:SDR family oxidoreductase [Salinisphaera sp.]